MEDTYMGEDGLLYCSKCGGARQATIDVPERGIRTVGCRCKCQLEEQNEFYRRQIEAEYNRRKMVCFGNAKKYQDTYFETCEENEVIKVAKNYADNFINFYHEGKGLLLHGTSGNGKSSAAACIANQLLKEGHKVHMTDFATVGNTLQGTFEKQEYIDDLCRFALLIIDDLGAERQTGYMQEIVFNVINSRLLTGKPLIITTNLDINDIKKIDDVGKGRIYDRLLEKCHPVHVEGASYRRKNVAKEFAQMEMVLKG